GAGGDHPAARGGRRADDHRLTSQFRAVANLDRGEEGVHVQVDDQAFHDAPPGTPDSPFRAPSSYDKISAGEAEGQVQARERVILAGLKPSGDLEAASLFRELAALAEAAGGEVVGEVTSARRKPHPATFIGPGKVEELEALVLHQGASVVLFNDELSPAQVRNLATALRCRVIDRTQLILDIFAQRARSREGKLQVELAQLEYLLPRLSGTVEELSRLGGGIGTRGPGETQLERDRRRVRRRLAHIRRELAAFEATRQVQ